MDKSSALEYTNQMFPTGANLEEKEPVQVEEKDEEVESVEEEKKSKEEPSPKKISEKEEEEKGTPKKVSESVGKRKRRGKGTSSSKELATTPIQRPSRERKIVQRYSTPSSGKSSASKTVNIQQGRGTPLKEIPNVAFKLSKRKADENLKILHTILFGKKTKIHNLKRNIHQFSGFVWMENEDKQRAKTREKLDKCVKEKLVDFCDMLDIPVSKATTKKDEVVEKLLEFLESPHATRDVSLADKEQSQKDKKLKRKTLASTGTASKDASSKKRKQTVEARKKQSNSTEPMDKGEDEDEEGESVEAKLQSDEDDVLVHKEEIDEDDEELSEKEDKAKEAKESKKYSAKKSVKQNLETKIKSDKGSPTKTEKNPKSEKSPAKFVKSLEKPKKSPSNSKKGAATDDKVSSSHSKSKVSTSKKPKGDDKNIQKQQSDFSDNKKTSKKQQSKLGAKLSGKKGSIKPAVTEPSRAEMHAAVGDLLRKVDFNTATLSDILRQLEKQFDMNLMHRKSDVRNIIEEVINSMTDEEDDGEEAEDANGNGSECDADKNNDD